MLLYLGDYFEGGRFVIAAMKKVGDGRGDGGQYLADKVVSFCVE